MTATLSRRTFLKRSALLGTAAMIGSAPVAATARAAAARRGGVLRIGSLAAPAHFDVHQSPTTNNLRPQGPMYDLLVRHNEADGGRTVVPDLAQRWEISPDRRVYTFFLRDGVKFHDGAPLTADDVQATMLKILDPPKGVVSPRKPLFAPVDSVDVVDRLTVRFQLKHPYASFLSVVGQGWNVIVRKETLKAHGGDFRTVIAPGTGPFRFKSHKSKELWVLERNPDYWNKGLPYLDAVEIHHFPPGSPATAALRARRLDVRELYIFPDDIQALSSEPRVKFERPLHVQYLAWLGDIARGELGRSFWRNEPIATLILDRGSVTVQIAVMAVAFSWLIGLPVGLLAAAKQDSVLDLVARGTTILGLAVPSFWLGTLIVLLLMVRFEWFPPLRYAYPWDDLWSNLQQTTLPALVLGLFLAAYAARMTRSAALEIIREDYVRTARAKGFT